MKPKILITGASGFIGTHLVNDALDRDFETWAAVRKTSSKTWLKDKRINFIELNLSSEEQLKEQLKDKQFDYVVHAAGVTKCLHQEDFFRINTEGTKNLVRAILSLKMPLKRFVFISSLSVMGAIREEEPHTEILESDTPQPNTAYGRSKLETEQWLAQLNEELKSKNETFPYIVLRPTGVYGPREHDYLMVFKSIKNHVDFSVGYKRQDITFIYVKDVVQAVFQSLEKGKIGRCYFLSDGEVYQSSTFSNLIRKELGNPWWIRIKAPLWVLWVITRCGEYAGHLTGKVTALNKDKYNIMRQRNWRCDITAAREDLGFEPEIQLEEGVDRCFEFFGLQGWDQ